MKSNPSDSKLLLIQEILNLQKETSLKKVEKLIRELRLSEDIEQIP